MSIIFDFDAEYARSLAIANFAVSKVTDQDLTDTACRLRYFCALDGPIDLSTESPLFFNRPDSEIDFVFSCYESKEKYPLLTGVLCEGLSLVYGYNEFAIETVMWRLRKQDWVYINSISNRTALVRPVLLGYINLLPKVHAYSILKRYQIESLHNKPIFKKSADSLEVPIAVFNSTKLGSFWENLPGNVTVRLADVVACKHIAGTPLVRLEMLMQEVLS